jgi:hypothetical protein
MKNIRKKHLGNFIFYIFVKAILEKEFVNIISVAVSNNENSTIYFIESADMNVLSNFCFG